MLRFARILACTLALVGALSASAAPREPDAQADRVQAVGEALEDAARATGVALPSRFDGDGDGAGPAEAGGAEGDGGSAAEAIPGPWQPEPDRPLSPSGVAAGDRPSDRTAGQIPPGITSRPAEAPQPPEPPPAVELPAGEQPRAPVKAPPQAVIKVILGLLGLLALAYVAGHPRVQEIEKRLGISQLVTTGLPFIGLGLLARSPTVGILSDDILVELSPLLHLGLGWIGFYIGFRFDARMLDTLPEGTAYKVGLSTGLPFLAIAIVAGLVFLGDAGWAASLRDPAFLRDAIILGSAGAITARSTPRLLGSGRVDDPRMLQIVRLEELAGIAGLTVVAAYFRPADETVSWHLPGTAWVFITLGLGATVGIVGYAILRPRSSPNESLVLLLGTVAFAAGLASNLLLSPIAVCFVAGVLLVNFPGDYKERVAATLARLERPIYLVFLVVVGAIWEVGDWRGWLLMAVFLLARFGGSVVGIRLGWSTGEMALDRDEQLVLAAAPMGQLSVAIVVSALLLYPHGNVPLMVTAVLGAAIVTEVLVQVLVRRLRSKRREVQT